MKKNNLGRGLKKIFSSTWGIVGTVAVAAIAIGGIIWAYRRKQSAATVVAKSASDSPVVGSFSSIGASAPAPTPTAPTPTPSTTPTTPSSTPTAPTPSSALVAELFQGGVLSSSENPPYVGLAVRLAGWTNFVGGTVQAFLSVNSTWSNTAHPIAQFARVGGNYYGKIADHGEIDPQAYLRCNVILVRDLPTTYDIPTGAMIKVRLVYTGGSLVYETNEMQYLP